MTIEAIPGWEVMRIGKAMPGDNWLRRDGRIEKWEHDAPSVCKNYVIVRQIEKPKKFRPFASAEEYVANRRDGFAVDCKNNTIPIGFFAVVSANDLYVWVAFGTVIERFEWGQAFEKLVFRHVDSSTSPFGIEVTE